jgi:hypothetical protein
MLNKNDITLALFKKGQPIYREDLIHWLDKNTTITCKEIVIAGKKEIQQESHPFFNEFLDVILEMRPDAKIILKTDGYFYLPLTYLYDLGDKAEIEIEMLGYNRHTYKKFTGNEYFDKIVENLQQLKAYEEYNHKRCKTRIVSPFYGDIEQACFRSRMLEFVDSFDYFS